MVRRFAKYLRGRLARYSDLSAAGPWLDKNFDRAQSFVSDRGPDIFFRGLKDAFSWHSDLIGPDLSKTITVVAVINVALASLPGKMGAGVVVSMGLEAVMAVMIARSVGLTVEQPRDVLKHFSALAGAGLFIGYGFVHLVRALLSVFSLVPGLPALALAELLATNLTAVLFIVGFSELKKTGSFKVPKRMGRQVVKEVRQLTSYQTELLKDVLSPSNLKRIASDFKQWLKGDNPPEPAEVRGDVFTHLAMYYLMSGEFERLEGPMGEAFVEAIRLRWSAQFDASSTIEDIAERFRSYEPEEMPGVINTIKGKMFEILVVEAENSDGDAWVARMHEDESFPGSDLIFTNEETGEQLAFSLKAVSEDNRDILEAALLRYPDIPIVTTDEMAAHYINDPRVMGSGILHQDLQKVTEENVETLIGQIDRTSAGEVVFNGQVVSAIVILWPFTAALLRGRINREQYTQAVVATLGHSGRVLAARVIAATAFGPIYAWYLLAMGINGVFDLVTTSPNRSEHTSRFNITA